MIFNVNGGSGINVSDTTATPPKVRAGEIFYDANGVRSEGTMPNGTATTPNTSIAQSTPSFTWNGATVTASVASKTQNVTPTVSAGYIDSGSAGTITLNASSGTTSIGTKAATTITPSASSQKAIASGSRLYFSGDLTVAAIPSPYRKSAVVAQTTTSGTREFIQIGNYATYFYASYDCSFTPIEMIYFCYDTYTSGYVNFSTGVYRVTRGGDGDRQQATGQSTTETNKYKSGNTVYLPSATGANKVVWAIILG